MKKRYNPAAKPCRDWKYILTDVLYALSLVFMGAVIGVVLCKCWPGFWNWLNSGWMESPWIPKAMFTVGAVCITAARCM